MGTTSRSMLEKTGVIHVWGGLKNSEQGKHGEQCVGGTKLKLNSEQVEQTKK